MKPLLAAIGVLMTLGLPLSAHCAPTEQTFAVPTTAALADLCADASPSDPLMTAAQNFCHGYLLGAYHVLLQVNAARGKPAFCMPQPSPPRSQAVADFVQWAKANPSEADRPPADGVFQFLTQRFPCAAKK